MHADTRRVLEAARVLLTDPACWATHAMATTAAGELVATYDERAVAFCLNGACCRAARELWHDGWSEVARDAARILADATQRLGWGEWFDSHARVASFNDAHGRTHDAVLALLDIALSELPASAPLVRELLRGGV